MKIHCPKVLSLSLALVLAGGLWLAQPAAAQVTGSVHDLNVYLGAGVMPDDRICVACHIAHNANSTEAPLWNHTVTSSAFTPYDSGTIQADGGTIGQPAGVSLMCLSCHDGSVAVDSFAGGAGTGGTLSGAANFGTDLSNDHPISFTYDAALATLDGQLYDPTATLSGVGSGNIDDDMLFGVANDQLECASCHDVHNGPAVVAGTPLLIKDNTGSALCLTCHNK